MRPATRPMLKAPAKPAPPTWFNRSASAGGAAAISKAPNIERARATKKKASTSGMTGLANAWPKAFPESPAAMPRATKVAAIPST